MSKTTEKSNRGLPKKGDTVFITKYTRAHGIIRATVLCDTDPGCPRMVVVQWAGGSDAYFHGNDWHTSLEDARVRADGMIKCAIKTAENTVVSLKDKIGNVPVTGMR